MNSVHFRAAAVTDVPALLSIRRIGESGGASFERMTQYIEGTHHPQLALQPRILWIAEDTASIVGYVAGHLTRRFQCDGELQWIYIVPDRRGTDLSSELLRQLAKWFVKHNAVRICVDVGNERARHFYMNNGAKELNEHWLVWDDIRMLV